MSEDIGLDGPKADCPKADSCSCNYRGNGDRQRAKFSRQEYIEFLTIT